MISIDQPQPIGRSQSQLELSLGERQTDFHFAASGEIPAKSVVAGLSRDDIDHMNPEDLVQVVRCVTLPYAHSHGDKHLQMLDGETLRRLAYLARRTCRNQGY